MQSYFYDLADYLNELLPPQQKFSAYFSGEDSDFVRFTASVIREPGNVAQRYVEIDLREGDRHVRSGLTLHGSMKRDRYRLREHIARMSEVVPNVAEDPHLLEATAAPSSEARGPDKLPEKGRVLAGVRAAAEGRDMAGLYAAGPIYRGFAHSSGQRNWFSTNTFNLDVSFFVSGGRASKCLYSGESWEDATFGSRVDEATHRLELIAKPPRALEPGRYRVFLSPMAVASLLDTASNGGFGLRSHRSGRTPLIRMVKEDARLHPAVSLRENYAAGRSPAFGTHGFPRPESVALVTEGHYADCLVSPRSAAEYGVSTNGAEESEVPWSLEMSAGTLPQDEVLQKLERGLYLSNLHYLNFSDRRNCRITGLTRFGSYWVEDRQFIAAIPVMRFDDSLYRILGDRLLELTNERQLIHASNTYGGRSLVSRLIPGALVEEIRLTL